MDTCAPFKPWCSVKCSPFTPPVPLLPPGCARLSLWEVTVFMWFVDAEPFVCYPGPRCALIRPIYSEQKCSLEPIRSMKSNTAHVLNRGVSLGNVQVVVACRVGLMCELVAFTIKIINQRRERSAFGWVEILRHQWLL